VSGSGAPQRLAPAGFAGKRGYGWVAAASLLVPVMMIGAYIILILTSEVGATGAAWEALGLAFVLVLWWLFRVLTEHAAISRAIAIGDADRVLELADHSLARRRRAASKARMHVYRALAREIRGEWADALAEVDAAKVETISGAPRKAWELFAATVKVAAYVETGKVAEARAVLDAGVEPNVKLVDVRMNASAHIHARLARGRVLWAEGKLDAARAELRTVIDDVRTGTGTRAIALVYAARCAAASDASAAATMRTRAAQLAPGQWAATASSRRS
jgi:hypothetical protein